MKQTKRKLSKIVNEMMTFCYSIGATDVLVHVIDDEQAHHITIRSDFFPQYKEKVSTLQTTLNKGRNPELEEMYWNLTGSSDLDDEIELQLVATLIDQATVQVYESTMEIQMLRLRKKAVK